MNAFIYTRVSNKAQAQKSGPTRQEEACRRACDERRWNVIGVIHEVGSAGDSWQNLPQLVQLITQVLPQYQPITLVAEDWARFSSAGAEDAKNLHHAARQAGVKLFTLEEADPRFQQFITGLMHVIQESRAQDEGKE